MPQCVQGAAGKEAAPHHNISAKKKNSLKTIKHSFFFGGGAVDCSRIFTFHGGFGK